MHIQIKKRWMESRRITDSIQLVSRIIKTLTSRVTPKSENVYFLYKPFALLNIMIELPNYIHVIFSIGKEHFQVGRTLEFHHILMFLEPHQLAHSSSRNWCLNLHQL